MKMPSFSQKRRKSAHRFAHRVSRGFTLLELMVVVAIIGILIAVAVPRYQDYMAQARVTEGLNLAAAVKATVVTNATSASASLSSGLSAMPATRSVSGITVSDNGVISIAYTAAVAPTGSNILKLIPFTTVNGAQTLLSPGASPASSIQWRCAASGVSAIGEESSGTLPAGLAPSECR